MCSPCSPSHKPTQRSQYGTKTLIGNWNEELFLLQSRTADYLARLNSGHSILAHNEQLTAYYHEPVQLEKPCLYLHYGAIVQLCAVDLPAEESAARRRRGCGTDPPAPPLMLSLTLPAEHLRHVTGLSALCDLSVAPNGPAGPCRRNTFRICRPRGAADAPVGDTEYLRYGEAFHLQLVQPDAEGVPLVLYSSLKNACLQNASSAALAAVFTNGHGEINQTVAVCQRQEPADERNWCLREIPPLHCNWRVLHRVPAERFEAEGEPVPSNERVVICHAASNKCLAAETVWSNNYFGREAGVSLENYQTIHRIETFQNRWLFKTAERV